jgi:hypothetical protein
LMSCRSQEAQAVERRGRKHPRGPGHAGGAQPSRKSIGTPSP